MRACCHQAGARLCGCIAQQRPRRLAALRLARNALGAATALALAPLFDNLAASPAATAPRPLALALNRMRMVDQPEVAGSERLGARTGAAGGRFAARHGGGACHAPKRLKAKELKAQLSERGLEYRGAREELVKRLEEAHVKEAAEAAAILAALDEMDGGRGGIGEIDRDRDLEQLVERGHSEAVVGKVLAKLEASRTAALDPLRLVGPRERAPSLDSAWSAQYRPDHAADLKASQVSEADVRALQASLRAKLAAHGMRAIDLLRRWDSDGNGSISVREFTKALRDLGIDFDHETAAQFFKEIDADGSGELDLEELKQKINEPKHDDADEAGEAAAAAVPVLTSLDLADNQLGGGALVPLLRVLRGSACALRALDLSRNRLPERACLQLTEALGANVSLTRLSLASIGLLAAPATALGDALRLNGKVNGARTSSTLQPDATRPATPVTRPVALCHSACNRMPR